MEAPSKIKKLRFSLLDGADAKRGDSGVSMKVIFCYKNDSKNSEF